MQRLILPVVMIGMVPAVSAMAQTDPAARIEKARAAFAATDTNKDGALSLQEWTAAGRKERGFKMIDADRDGKLTPAELKAIADKYGARRYPRRPRARAVAFLLRDGAGFWRTGEQADFL